MSDRDEEERRRDYRVKVYTIRGLDPVIYERFTSIAREIGKSIGELMNEAMRNIITVIDIGRDIGKVGISAASAASKALKEAVKEATNFEVISSIDELEVDAESLKQVEKPVIFTNIKKLVFADDVDWELINSKVKEIVLVDEVLIPKHIPKLLLARKCRMVRRIAVKGKE